MTLVQSMLLGSHRGVRRKRGLVLTLPSSPRPEEGQRLCGIFTEVEQPVLKPFCEGYHNSPWETPRLFLSHPYFTDKET